MSGIDVPAWEDSLAEVVMVNAGGWGATDDGGGMVASDVETEGVGAEGGAADGGLMMRWTVAPDSNAYSFKSLVSVRAFPLNKRRCASGAGAEADDSEMMDLRSETVSVSWAVTGMVRDGLSDLTVREMTVSLDVIRTEA